MGRTVSSHPGHLAGQSDPVIPVPSLMIRPSSPASAPTDSATAGKQACSHAPDTARTCSNSPLASSLSSTPPPTCYDAGPTSFSSSPFLSLTSNALVDGEDTFYDAVEQLPPQSHQPIRANVEQIPAPKFQGAAKGRMGVTPSRGPARGHNTYAHPATPAANPFPPVMFGRGPSRPTASSTPAQQSALVPSLSAVPTRSQRALLVGINYAHFGEDKRLWYAAQDAARFGKSLKTSGFLPENIRCINEEAGSQLPTYEALLYHIDWLVRDARKGDTLFFMFSGHCVKDRGLLTHDGRFISQQDLHRALVLRVPEGCDLQIVFDCCHAASMVPLQYCVGHMAPPRPPSPEPAQPEEPECPEADPRSSDHASAQPRQDPLIGSLDGLPAVAAAPPSPDVTPEMVDLPSFAPAPSQRQRGGVVAAPPVEPVAAPAETVAGRATGFVASWLGFGQTASAAVPTPGSDNVPSTSSRAPAAAKPWRGRQVVAEGERAPDYFAERKEGFIKPAGNVTVWAGTGEDQRAFEAYGNARHGIVTHAICGALDACANSKLTRRDLWKYLVGEIDKENVLRGKRDAKKSEADRQDPRMRVQHAELWVSQGRPIESATSVLDQLVF